MKSTIAKTLLAALVGVGAASAGNPAVAQEVKIVRNVAVAGPEAKAAEPGEKKKSIVIKRIESGDDEKAPERTWLGVGLTEPDEALVAQLGLKDGAGLVVTYVAEDSPASKAGVQKNDILLEMEGQTLVVAPQLQKLVQARKEGDTVSLKLLRGGKKETVKATLGKTKVAALSDMDENTFVWNWKDAAPGAMAFSSGDHAAMADHVIVLKKALEDAKVDQKRIQVEVRRSVDEARKAMEEALRTTGKAATVSGMQRKELEALAKSGVFVPQDASVTIRRVEKSSQSLVSTDDSGTIVLVKNPKLRLTAHDKDGKMLFDGEVETAEQRAKIPDDLRKKVEPMIEKFTSGDDE
jgi:membrane-associated protease RseP (regulator of RpoE activity)